jgi:hypothetical protein
MAVLVFPVSNVGQACGKFGPIGIFQQGYFDLRLRQSLMAMRNKGVLRFIKVVFQGLIIIMNHFMAGALFAMLL